MKVTPEEAFKIDSKTEEENRTRAWKDLMAPLGRYWMENCVERAWAEGWDVFQAERDDGTTLEINALDDPEVGGGGVYLTGGDAEAYDIVAKRALEGSKLHILALFLDGKLMEDG